MKQKLKAMIKSTEHRYQKDLESMIEIFQNMKKLKEEIMLTTELKTWCKYWKKLKFLNFKYMKMFSMLKNVGSEHKS